MIELNPPASSNTTQDSVELDAVMQTEEENNIDEVSNDAPKEVKVDTLADRKALEGEFILFEKSDKIQLGKVVSVKPNKVRIKAKGYKNSIWLTFHKEDSPLNYIKGFITIGKTIPTFLQPE